MGVRSTNDVIQSLGVCAGEGGCGGCGLRDDLGERCITELMLEAHAALTAMQDRCARYAEEIMVLRQQLEEVRHD